MRAHRRRLQLTLIALAAALAAPVAAAAQAVTVFGGYEWPSLDFENVHLLTSDWNGWQAGAVVPVVPHAAVVVRTDGVYGTPFDTGIVVRPNGTARPFIYTTEAGARYIAIPDGWIAPFAEALVGVAHGQIGTMGVDFVGTTTDTRATGEIGAGATLRITRHFGAQADVGFRRTSLFDQRLDRVAFDLAATWRFGGRKQP